MINNYLRNSRGRKEEFTLELSVSVKTSPQALQDQFADAGGGGLAAGGFITALTSTPAAWTLPSRILATTTGPAAIASSIAVSNAESKAAAKDARSEKLGYEPRRELVRRAAKFMADLGAHPEAGETRKPDAYAALMIAGGLLHGFSRAAGS